MPHRKSEERPGRGAQRQGEGDNRTVTKDSTGSNRPVVTASPERKSARLGAPARKTAERIAWERSVSGFLGDSPAWAEIERPGGAALLKAAGRIAQLVARVARELDVYPTSALEVALMSLVMNDPAVWPKEQR